MSKASTMDDAGILQTLLRFDRLSIDLPEIRGPLSAATACGKVEAVQILMQHGENVNEDNSRVLAGRSPLQAAVETGNLVLIDLFLKAGADINALAARKRGATALQLAAITGRLGIARTLIDLGADINAPGADFYGRTALEGAAEHARLDTVQYLLSEGASTTGRWRLQYLRAIRYAELNGFMVVANLLRSYREWTADDEDMWAELKDLKTADCDEYGDNRSEEEMGSEEDTNAQEDAAEIAMAEDLDPGRTYDNAGSSQVPINTALSTAHLEDLEMLTRNPLGFW